MHPWARAFICTSLVAAGVAAAGEPPLNEGGVSALEMEARLARTPDVYLVLDAPRRVLEIRARGLVLDSVRLSGIEMVDQHPLFGRGSTSTLKLPAEFTIETGARDTSREVIAPDKLVPAPKDDSDAPETGAQGTPAPEPTPTPVPEPPASYRVRLDNGWDLWITDVLPGETRWARYVAAVKDGFLRLTGRARSYPSALTLSMSREDTKRLHHLLTKGTVLLVVGDGRG